MKNKNTFNSLYMAICVEFDLLPYLSINQQLENDKLSANQSYILSRMFELETILSQVENYD